MAAIARLAAVSVDTSDPVGLSKFYRELLDLEVMFESDAFIALQGGAILLTVQKVDDHQPPEWPTGVPKQIHLELAVTDLDDAETEGIGHRREQARHAAEPRPLARPRGPGRPPVLHHHTDPRLTATA